MRKKPLTKKQLMEKRLTKLWVRYLKLAKVAREAQDKSDDAFYTWNDSRSAK